MKKYLIDKLKYNLWANSRTIKSLMQAEASEKAFSLMGHILDAQGTWLVRIQKPDEASKNFWHNYSIEQMEELNEKSNKEWEDFISFLDDEMLQKEIRYTNSKGEEYTNTIQQIITHVLNHSTYHRGQIAAEIRKSGGTPAVTDYIVFKRT